MVFNWFKKKKIKGNMEKVGESERVDENTEKVGESERVDEDTEKVGESERVDEDTEKVGESEQVDENTEKVGESEQVDEDTEKVGESEQVDEDTEKVGESEQVDEDTEKVGESERVDEDKGKKGFFAKIKDSLFKTKTNIFSGVERVLGSFTKIDDELFEELEESLIMSDIGVATSTFIIEKVKEIVKIEKIKEPEEIKNIITRVIAEILEKDTEDMRLTYPSVMLIIGVNGVGKTTTIGKLAHNYKKQGKNVLLVAGDTFRAAAIEQLQVWGDRNGVSVVKHQENSDPASVVYDGIQAGKSRNADIIICDTAGRLHNKKNLMEELKKIVKIIKRESPNSQIETLLVLDATTGQNALQQAKLFSEVADITGLVLTKLDGTAKGGIIIAIKNEMNIPVRFIGVGEGIDDLQPFDAKEFSKAFLG